MEDRAAAAPPEEEERPSTALVLKSLADYTVGAIPSLFYVPGFISQAEQSQLLHHVLIPAPSTHPRNPDLAPCMFDSLVVCRYTKRRRQSGNPSRIGGCRTGVCCVILAPAVWLGEFSVSMPLLSARFDTVFAFVAGGVVHEKGLLPQACEYSLKLAKF